MGFLKTVPDASQMLTPPNARGCHWVMMEDVTCAILREYGNMTQKQLQGCLMHPASYTKLKQMEEGGRKLC